MVDPGKRIKDELKKLSREDLEKLAFGLAGIATYEPAIIDVVEASIDGAYEGAKDSLRFAIDWFDKMAASSPLQNPN